MANKIAFIVSIILVLGVAVLVFFLSTLEPIRVWFSPFNVSVNVGNSPPVIEFVNFTNQGAVPEGVKNVLINFTVRDPNLVGDINDSSARVEIYNLSLTSSVRYNSTCSPIGNIGPDRRNYNCEVGMWYFDPYGNYIVNVTIADNSSAKAENSSKVFTYQVTHSQAVYPGGIGWPPISVTSTDQLSNDPLISNNTGNVNYTDVSITAFDLPGSVIPGFIFAGNFTVNIANSCSGGDVLGNNTQTPVTSASLPIGNLSQGGGTAQEQLYFCIKAINSGTQSQSYSTANNGGIAWEIDFS